MTLQHVTPKNKDSHLQDCSAVTTLRGFSIDTIIDILLILIILFIVLSWSSVSFKVSTIVAYRISTIWICLIVSLQLIPIMRFGQEFSI